MREFLYIFFFYFIIIPGTPLATLLGRFKQMSDGTDNESGMIEFYKWATIFGIVSWLFVVAGSIWILDHLSLSIAVR